MVLFRDIVNLLSKIDKTDSHFWYFKTNDNLILGPNCT